MSETDCRSSVPPPIATPAQASPQSLSTVLPSLDASLVLLGERSAAWLERLAPVLRELSQALEEMTRLFAPQLLAFSEAVRRPETQAFIRGLAEWSASLDAAPSYCLPYERELARLGMKSLTAEEQRDLMVMATVLQDKREIRLGHRLPLMEVALAAGRFDIAAALVMGRAATQRAIRSVEIGNEQEEGELVTTAYLELDQHIFPSILRRLDRVPLRDAGRILQPKLKQVVRDAYLVTSIRRALVRRLGREAQRKEREGEWDEEAQQRLAQMRHELTVGISDRNRDIEQAMASFLERPRVSALDRKLVAALRRWPDSSAREIAGRIGEPVRTVQYHYAKLVGYVTKQVES